MDISVAAATVRATREQATIEARNDLHELSRRAVEAGRERSRRIIKTTRIDNHTGELRYNPAGRLLRDWYFHVYLNTLRRNLGEPAATINAQQVEDTTSLLHRLRPGANSLACLRVVGTLRNTALDDASHAAADIVDHLATVGARRAVLHAADDRFGDDTLATHITRHWYLHCYDNTIYAATDTQHPKAGNTRGQELDVAEAMTTGRVRPIIDAEGLPLSRDEVRGLTAPSRDWSTAGSAGMDSLIADAREAATLMFNHGDTLDAATPRVADPGASGSAIAAVDDTAVEETIARHAHRGA